MSTYYMVKFFMEHERSPTWNDAMAHRTRENKEICIQALVDMSKVHAEDSEKGEVVRKALEQLRENDENRVILEEVIGEK